MYSLTSDVRHALRTARLHPFVALAVMLSVAICTGPNCALFSVVTSVLLRPWPVEKPNQLAYVGIYQQKGGMSYPDYEDLAHRSHSFAGIIAWERNGALLNIHGQTEIDLIDYVSGNYFSVLGVKPQAGGPFAPASGWSPSGEPEVVMSHRLWRSRFNSAPAVVGSSIYLNDRAYVVVGIAPPGFRGVGYGFEAPVDLWVTFDSLPTRLKADYMRRDGRSLEGLGRLRKGATFAQARTELHSIALQLAQEYPATDKGCDGFVEEAAKKNSRVGLYFGEILMSLVDLVLFIACVNIANLMLAHAAGQRRQTAIRAALGASRGRLFQRFVTESVLLSIGGTAIGLLFTPGLVHVLNLATSSVIPVDYNIHISWRVLAYGTFLAFAMGPAFGLWPAIRASRRNVLADLNATSAAYTESRGRMPVLKILLIIQIAAAQFLVAGTFAVLSISAHAQKESLGFDTHRKLLLIDVTSFDLSKPNDWSEIADQLRDLPGVRDATYANPVPLSGHGMESLKVTAHGTNVPGRMGSVSAALVGPAYFGVLGTRILAGRDFVRQDVASKSSLRVAALSAAAARALWPNTPLDQVVGRWIHPEGFNDLRVVAVVEDGKYSTLYEQPQECLFLPLSQSFGDMTLVVEAAGEPSALAGVVRHQLDEMHPSLDVISVNTMKQHLQLARRFELLGTGVLGALAALAVALACIGLYGSASYAASSRSRELGIRIALGAQRKGVLWLCLRQGAAMALAGMAFGLLGAYAITQRVLEGAGAASPLSFIVGALLIGSLIMLAILIPAYQATCVDPATALRAQ